MHKNKLDEPDRRLSKQSRLPLLTFLATVALFLAVSSLKGQGDPLGLNFSGDFRLRHETTSKQEPGEVPDVFRDPRRRGVVRFRLGMSKEVNGLFKFGARLATGSPDDPNTTDVTMGDFVNDLSISLDQVYLELRYQDLFVTGGKFGNPFLKTELVWDGDVNPQGLAASYTFKGTGQITPKLIGVYSIIDEQTTNSDSYMLGGQAQLLIKSRSDWSLTLAGGYYDYRIQSLTNAGAGDVLSNNLTANGTEYRSDFDLLNIITVVEYRGLNERFPIRFVGDYVKNQGAAVDEDTGFGLDVYVGKASQKGDWRFQYGYAKAETDAVLAAFSHDNTTIASNYQQHTFAVDYVAVEETVLNLTLYHYRADKFEPLPGLENEFFTRIRLNALVSF